MSLMRRLGLVSGLLLLAACNGWGTELEETCTSLPCPVGLQVQLEGTPAENYSVAARVPHAAPWVVECTSDDPCDQIVFPDFIPSSVEITYTSPDAVVTKHFDPEYVVTYPNGEECGECRHATLVLPVGGGTGDND